MTKIYGLLGRKLGHSFSAKFHNERFRRKGIDAEYRNFEIDSVGQFQSLIADFPDLMGVNVTIPFKETIIPLLDEVSADAKSIGAVNTVKIIRNNDGLIRTAGYNSDAAGFSSAVKPHLPEGTDKALVLGTGGASKAACFALMRMGITPHTVSRSEGNYTYAELTSEIVSNYRLIVNATPLGMWPDTQTAPEIPYEGVRADAFCFDMVYNPAVTEFMKRCAVNGAAVACGIEMLRAQGIAASEIWLGPIQ